MKCDPPNETTTAGAHIGFEIWMVNSPASQSSLWFAKCCYLWPQERLGIKLFICRGGGGGRGWRGSPCHLRPVQDVLGIWNENRKLTELLAFFFLLSDSKLPLPPPFSPRSLPFCPPLTAPAVSMRRQYLRATENLALHVNYISGSLPRALRLSPHVKNKGIMQKSINSLNTFYMVHSLECIQRWNLLWKRLSEVSWVT